MAKQILSKKLALVVNLVFLNLSVVGILAFGLYNGYFGDLTEPVRQTSAATMQNLPEDHLCSRVLEQVNHERLKAGLDPLREEELLTSAANQKLADLKAYDYFSHVNPTTQKRWSDFIREAGYEYAEIGENLALGYQNPEEAVEAWLSSPTHKKNLLSPKFKESGVAYKQIDFQGKPTTVLVHFLGG